MALLLCVLGLCALTGPAAAEQRRDWMIDVQEPGTHLLLDAVFLGVQGTLEHRIPIYDNKLNQFILRANALHTVPFFQSQVDAEIRMLVLTLGGSVGFRNTFRLMEFEPGDDMSRSARVDRDLQGRVDHALFPYWEGRATLSLPINHYVVFQSVNTFRQESRPDRSFDWFLGVVHDGSTFRSDNQLFFKHRDWGGIGPMLQVMNFNLDGRRHTHLNYGGMLATRPGFMARDDLVFLQLLYHGTTLSGMNNREVYGMHLFFAPVTMILAYRTVISL